ncbi:hypothetical protein CQ020_00295 [Arthrobacter sp. MYb23]|nr:hypothetical protein CQ038_02485 [Arthrobacter sp. MYb51]PRB99281.1 hypothetical protein CQ020_00295 [Arthrobacter sp. MYb23]
MMDMRSEREFARDSGCRLLLLAAFEFDEIRIHQGMLKSQCVVVLDFIDRHYLPARSDGGEYSVSTPKRAETTCFAKKPY